jgi:hypothetical protein
MRNEERGLIKTTDQDKSPQHDQVSIRFADCTLSASLEKLVRLQTAFCQTFIILLFSDLNSMEVQPTQVIGISLGLTNYCYVGFKRVIVNLLKNKTLFNYCA